MKNNKPHAQLGLNWYMKKHFTPARHKNDCWMFEPSMNFSIFQDSVCKKKKHKSLSCLNVCHIFPLFEFMFITLIYMKFEFYNFVTTWYMKIILCTFNIDVQDINWTRCLHGKLNSCWKTMWWVTLHLSKCFVFIRLIVSRTPPYGLTCWLIKPRRNWKRWLLVGTLTLRPYILQVAQSQPYCLHLSDNLLPFLQHFVQKIKGDHKCLHAHV